MDNQQAPEQPTVQPQVSHSPVVGHVSRRKRPIFTWLLLLVLLAAVLALSYLYLDSKKRLSENQQQHATLQTQLSSSEQSLKQAQERLKLATFLPNKNEMSPQCNSANNNQTKLAPVNSEPIDGYNVYIVNCVDDLVRGRQAGKVIAFRVEESGKQTFKYGAGSGEPYCVSGKILPAIAAANISKQTGLPICKTF